jgi:hypothetical protein
MTLAKFLGIYNGTLFLMGSKLAVYSRSLWSKVACVDLLRFKLVASFSIFLRTGSRFCATLSENR